MNPDNKDKAVPVSSEFLAEIFELRMVVLLETNPQSNKYHQILLTPEQYKRFSLALRTILFGIEVHGKVAVPIDDRIIEAHSEMKSSYQPKL